MITRFVMPGLAPGIHVLVAGWKNVDGRDKPGHDGAGFNASIASARPAKARTADLHEQKSAFLPGVLA